MNGPVGWFPDPDGGNGLRYFDGKEWTQIAPPPAPAPVAAPTPVSVVVNNTNTVGTQDNSGCVMTILLIFLTPILIPVGMLLYHFQPTVFCIAVAAIVVMTAGYFGRVKADREKRENEKLSARAEVENELFLQGDPRGAHGKYPPPFPPTV